MQINYNVTGEQRKALVQAISEITELPAVYIAGDGRSYAIGDLTVDKDGILDYSKHDGFIHLLVNVLAVKGFSCEPQDGNNTPIEEQTHLCIDVPLEGFTEATLDNLERLVLSKVALIKKAIGAGALPIERTETTLRFPWFNVEASPEEVQTYAVFIERLCTTAKERERIMSVEREVDNEKYAFRCFLLKLGFIGESYKIARKILLSRLEGDSAWRE